MIPLIFVYPIVASALCVPVGTNSQAKVLGYFAEAENVSNAAEVGINPADADLVGCGLQQEAQGLRSFRGLGQAW
jgi:hypothetical protein